MTANSHASAVTAVGGVPAVNASRTVAGVPFYAGGCCYWHPLRCCWYRFTCRCFRPYICVSHWCHCFPCCQKIKYRTGEFVKISDYLIMDQASNYLLSELYKKNTDKRSVFRSSIVVILFEYCSGASDELAVVRQHLYWAIHGPALWQLQGLQPQRYTGVSSCLNLTVLKYRSQHTSRPHWHVGTNWKIYSYIVRFSPLFSFQHWIYILCIERRKPFFFDFS